MANLSLLILNGPDATPVEGGLDQVASSNELENVCTSLCAELQIDMSFMQAQTHAEMEDWFANLNKSFDAIIIHPGGAGPQPLSEAACQSLCAFGKPICEVHLHNIFQPSVSDPPVSQPNATTAEPLRITGADLSLVCGFGLQSYLFAIRALHQRVTTS